MKVWRVAAGGGLAGHRAGVTPTGAAQGRRGWAVLPGGGRLGLHALDVALVALALLGPSEGAGGAPNEALGHLEEGLGAESWPQEHKEHPEQDWEAHVRPGPRVSPNF